MTIQNEEYTLRILDNAGQPKTGSLVELKAGASTFPFVEVGNGYYKIDTIPTGKYNVWVDSVNTNETRGVGTGQVAALGNETDEMIISTSSDFVLGDKDAVKAVLDLDNVSNISLPDPTGQDGKVLSVDSDVYVLEDVGTPGEVKVSPNDTTPGFLSEKLEAGNNIDLSIENPGANETIKVTANTTSAGVLTRVYFTGDVENVDGTNYYELSDTGEGAVASVEQQVVVGDDTKDYFAQDFISGEYLGDGVIRAGSYVAQLSVKAVSNSGQLDQQRFKVEFYKTDSLGVIINAGGPIGDPALGSKETIQIIDSGLKNLVDGLLTNILLQVKLDSDVSVLAGNRILAHVSAEKVGTIGGSNTLSLYSGSDHSSYLDIPADINTDAVTDLSDVNTGGILTQSLNTIKGWIDAINTALADYMTLNTAQTVNAVKTFNAPQIFEAFNTFKGYTDYWNNAFIRFYNDAGTTLKGRITLTGLDDLEIEAPDGGLIVDADFVQMVNAPTDGNHLTNKTYVDANAGGQVDSVTSTDSNVVVNNIDPANPTLSAPNMAKTNVDNNFSAIQTFQKKIRLATTTNATPTIGDIHNDGLDLHFYTRAESGVNHDYHLFGAVTSVLASQDTATAPYGVSQIANATATDLPSGWSTTGNSNIVTMGYDPTSSLNSQIIIDTNANNIAWRRRQGEAWQTFGGGGGATKLKYQSSTNIANLSAESVVTADTYFATKFIPEADIDVNTFDCFITSGHNTGDIFWGIYNEAGTTLLAEVELSSGSQSDGLNTSPALSSTLSLTGGTTYWIALATNASGSMSMGNTTGFADSELSKSAYVSFNMSAMPSSIASGTASSTRFYNAVRN